jgi:hypothetical protein
MDSHLIDALIRSLEQEPALSVVDLVRRTKIIVKTCSDKNTNERILITKILMIISRGRDLDGDLIAPEIMHGIKALIDGGLVGQVADEIKVRSPWCDCCF